MEKKIRITLIVSLAFFAIASAFIWGFIFGSSSYYSDGKALLEKGDHENAIAAFTKALEEDDTNPDIYICRGEAYLAIRYYKEAIDDYTVALKLDNKSEAAYLGIATAFEANGQMDRAVLALKVAIDMHVFSESVSERLALLEKTVEQEYISRFKCTQSNNVAATFFADYNGDGLGELVVFNGPTTKEDNETIFQGFIYYVTNDKIEKVGHSSDASPIGISLNGSDAPVVVHQGNNAFLVFNGIYTTSSSSSIFYCIDNQPKITKCGGHLTCYDGGLLVEQSTLDGVISKADFAAGKYSGMVRTLKPYWYYWDTKENRLKEYGAIEITKDEFLKLNGAQGIWDSITSGKVHNILYRANGIITINILEACDGMEKNDSYSTTNLILECTNNSVAVSKQFTSPESGFGFYLTALNPSVATYPEKFDPINPVIIPADVNSATSYSLESFLKPTDPETIYNQFLEANTFFYNWAVQPYFLDENFDGNGPMSDGTEHALVAHDIINSADALKQQLNLRFDPVLTERLLKKIQPQDKNGSLYITCGAYMPEGTFYSISDHSFERVSDDEYILTLTAYFTIDYNFYDAADIPHYTYKIKCKRNGSRWIFCDTMEGQTTDTTDLYFK